MQTTFSSRILSKVTKYRNNLHPQVTKWKTYSRHRPRTAPPAVQPAPFIPATASEFAVKTLEFPVDDRQREILDSPSRHVVVCCCRQWGKSTTGAIKALHHALTNPGSLVLVASRTLRQAGELLEKVIGFSKLLGLPVRRAPRHDESLLLPNGSRIIALPGQPDSLRGFSAVSLLIVDEAAYVPDDLYHSLRPMLATTNGAIWLLSTPRNRAGFFYDEWSSPQNTGSKFTVTVADCPRISEEFLADEHRLHGPALFMREYYCDFGYTGQSFFEIDALDQAVGVERYHAAEEFASARPTTRFYIGFDLGQKATPSAVVILELVRGTTQSRDPVTFQWISETHLIFRKIERFPLNTPYDSLAQLLNRMVRDLGDPRDITMIVDATGCGQPFLEILRRQDMKVLISAVSITASGPGSFSHGIERVSKKALMANANYALMSKCLSGEPGMSGLKALREEMEAYRIRTSRAGHDSFRSGQSDDLVMAYALAVWKARVYLQRAD